MSFLDRLRSTSIKARAVSRLAPNALEIWRGGHANGALLLERNAARFPHALALAFRRGGPSGPREERFTWTDVNAHANRWARFFLSRGIARGDVVALIMDNRPEYVFALFGLSKLRAITACVNTNVRGEALEHALRAARPRLVVLGSEHGDALASLGAKDGSEGTLPPVVVHADPEHDGGEAPGSINLAIAAQEGTNVGGLRPLTEEPMAYLYTSGTTGFPKAAVITNQRFLAASYAFGKIMHEAGPGDVLYVSLPLYHGTAQWGGLGACVATGAAMALRRKFSASAFWTDAARYEASHVLYIGELCRYLLHQPASAADRAHRVRVAVGNGLRPDVWPAFQERFGVPLIREFYGATEGNAPIVNLEGRPGMLGRLGRGQALVECDQETGRVIRAANGRARRLTKPGETGLFVGRISATATFDGYVDANATNAKILTAVFSASDTWFNSGDLMTLHEDGWVSFADRIGDTFRFKGENVSTAEVSALINGAAGVLESNVYGVLVPGTDGRAGMANLRVREDFDLARFAGYVRERLPRYAQPLFVRLSPELRVTATLKQQKVDYRNEGYDPDRIAEPLFLLVGGGYVPLTRDLYARIQSGELKPG